MTGLLAATRAEFTKIITLRVVWLVTGAVLGLQLLVETQALSLYADAVAQITPDGTIEIFRGQREPAYRAMREAMAASSLQMSIFLPCLAAVLAGQEFRGGQLGLTMLTVPRRGRLLAAKTLAAAGYLTLTALLIAASSSLFGYLAVRDWDPGLPLSAAAIQDQVAFIGYAVLLCLSTSAITVVARGTLAGIIASLALIAVTMTQVFASYPWLDALFPVGAGRNLLLNPQVNELSGSPRQAALVLVGWALGSTLVAGIALARRDAR